MKRSFLDVSRLVAFIFAKKNIFLRSIFPVFSKKNRKKIKKKSTKNRKKNSKKIDFFLQKVAFLQCLGRVGHFF